MLTLDSIRDCLEGAVPSAVATCDADGTPNATFVSQVHYVDGCHVALSYQFFNKTRANVLVNPRAVALVNHPLTAMKYRLELEYLRTESEGPLFENMKAKLAGIASHTGMAGVFRLLGSDVYRVLDITVVPGRSLPLAAPRPYLLSALRDCIDRTASAADLQDLFERTLESIESRFGIHHAMVLMLDGAGSRLYTVATRGYPASGIGSEIATGCGVIGVAAAERAPIRISHPAAEYAYGRAIRESLEREGLAGGLETEIPFPGLPDPGSQLAAPIVSGTRLLGVLYLESSREMRFGYDHEDALVLLAAHLGGVIERLDRAAESQEGAPSPGALSAPTGGSPVVIRHYAEDDSVFIDDDYLIKGVAGAILSRLVTHFLRDGRTDFTNRELRLDPTLRLPEISDNLEARLILLERRLEERRAPLRIEKTGRGRFRLRVERPMTFTSV